MPSPLVLRLDDGSEYAHLAQSLLHGSVLVDYDSPPRLTRYTPGFSILLMPAVALGGLEAAVWVPFIAALALGVLVAFVAWRAAGSGLAAPLAALLVLVNPGVYFGAQMIMSDVPSATIAIGELALLAIPKAVWPDVVAGVLAGYLVWLRPAALVLALAGIAGLSAVEQFRRRAAWYLSGALPPVLLLAGWQWLALGSPLTTSYQATGASATGGSDIGSFISLAYIFGPPWNTYAAGFDPNIAVYLRASCSALTTRRCSPERAPLD